MSPPNRDAVRGDRKTGATARTFTRPARQLTVADSSEKVRMYCSLNSQKEKQLSSSCMPESSESAFAGAKEYVEEKDDFVHDPNCRQRSWRARRSK